MAITTIECKKHKYLDLVGDYRLCILCGECFPLKEEPRIPLRKIHFIIMKEIIHMFPGFFRKNRTAFYYSEMWRYIYEKKVFRDTTMGETRGGKSELDQTTSINYVRIYNALFNIGHFNDIDITYKDGKKIILQPLTFTVDHIHANQSAYLYNLRDITRNQTLIFGQRHIIDEERDNPGGVGSFSEEVETLNLNNIVAKFMQSEGWIRPRSFQQVNAPYGLNVMIKDEKNKTNWALIYKIEMNSAGLREQNFIGWVGIALHDDTTLRKAYQEKKNAWIEQELKGTINERVNRRYKAIEYLINDPDFMRHTIGKDGNVKFYYGIETMKFLVEEAMRKEKIDSFNETEIERIVHGARAQGEQKIKGKVEP